MGAIDFEKSPLNQVPRKDAEGNAFFTTAELNFDNDPIIVMRRGVRLFDLTIEGAHNTLMVTPEIAEISNGRIHNSTNGLTPVTCQFGKRRRPYLFGNLSVHDADCFVDWDNSLFNIADPSLFEINKSRIEDGKVPLEHEIEYHAENVRFGNVAEARAASSVSRKIIPSRLSIYCKPVDIIHFTATQALISKCLYDLVMGQERPKYRVPGIVASRPLVQVEFLDPTS